MSVNESIGLRADHVPFTIAGAAPIAYSPGATTRAGAAHTATPAVATTAPPAV